MTSILCHVKRTLETLSGVAMPVTHANVHLCSIQGIYWAQSHKQAQIIIQSLQQICNIESVGECTDVLTSLSMHPWLVRFSCSGIIMSSKSLIICSACRACNGT